MKNLMMTFALLLSTAGFAGELKKDLITFGKLKDQVFKTHAQLDELKAKAKISDNKAQFKSQYKLLKKRVYLSDVRAQRFFKAKLQGKLSQANPEMVELLKKFHAKAGSRSVANAEELSSLFEDKVHGTEFDNPYYLQGLYFLLKNTL